jgi:hypothetical protein
VQLCLANWRLASKICSSDTGLPTSALPTCYPSRSTFCTRVTYTYVYPHSWYTALVSARIRFPALPLLTSTSSRWHVLKISSHWILPTYRSRDSSSFGCFRDGVALGCYREHFLPPTTAAGTSELDAPPNISGNPTFQRFVGSNPVYFLPSCAHLHRGLLQDLPKQ